MSKPRATGDAGLAYEVQGWPEVFRPGLLGLATAVMASVACSGDSPRTRRPPPGPPVGAVVIHQPERLTSVATGELDALGRPARVACATCHTLRTPTRLPSTMDELDEFHQGLTFDHGALSCGSCHVVGDQRALRLADGSRVDMRDAIQLCRQCHGPQARAYDHGAHGGMTGHWDLSVGGRTRNHCVDCHDPHVPAIPQTMPVLPPRDRGLSGHPTRHPAGDHP